MSEVRAFAPNLNILVPQPEFITVMLDKFSCARLLEEKGLPAPKTATVAEGGVDFPCVIKPRQGRGSRGVHIIERSSQAEAYCQLYRVDRNQVILQERLSGQEYTVMMAANRRGALQCVVPVKVQVKRGVTLRAETENSITVIEGCRAIHDAIPTAGCYNIQLMLTADQRVVPFEINPRVSTTFCLAIAAGVDPIELYFEASQADCLARFESDIKLVRYWCNSFIREPDK